MMRRRVLVLGSSVALIVALVVSGAVRIPSAAGTTCKDGTTSSATGQGACADHGGVATSAPSSGVATAAPSATPAPSGAATLCNDGSYNAAGDPGACAQHGGVAPNGGSYSPLPAALVADQPDQVTGRLTVNGRPAPAGVTVAAYSGLTLCGSAASAAGQFTVSLDTALDVCWSPQNVISFQVNGVPAPESVFTPPVASIIHIDLSADGVSLAPSVKPTPSATAASAPAIVHTWYTSSLEGPQTIYYYCDDDPALQSNVVPGNRVQFSTVAALLARYPGRQPHRNPPCADGTTGP